MRSLADYETESQYLGEGTHTVTVVNYEMVNGKTNGTQGIDFTFRNEAGATIRRTFWMTEKAMRMFASFAIACGLSKEDRERFDVDRPTSNEVLIGKVVEIDVASVPSDDGAKQYKEVTHWRACTTTPPVSKVPTIKPEPKASPAPAQEGGDDDLPF